MNAREEARRMAEVMLAFADGLDVQYRIHGCDVWIDTGHPTWNWPKLDYCIKPKPREEWRVVDKDGHAWFAYANADTAQSAADRCAHNVPFSAPFSVVHMREVTE